MPVHHYYKLQIKPNKVFDSTTNSKLIIVEINKKGYKVNRKGEFVDGFVSTRVREYGKYAVSIGKARENRQDKEPSRANRQEETIARKVLDLRGKGKV